MENIKIYVASHKKVDLSFLPDCYFPLQVGTSINGIIDETWINDNKGIGISEKNLEYNELTGAYWIWKNSDADIVGLCHYRRFFTDFLGRLDNLLFLHKKVLSQDSILELLNNSDAIVHKPTFFPFGNKRHFEKRSIGTKDLILARQIIKKYYPDYLKDCDKVLYSHFGHMFNMIITRKDIYNNMCKWMFDILFGLDKIISRRNEDLSRRLGMVGERLMDIWLIHNNVLLHECHCINTEKRTFEFLAL